MNMNANDGLQNVVAELGTPKDKASAWTYAVRYQSNIELENIYRSSWLGRKIVDVPVDDMTRSWRTWHAEDTLVDRIEAAERKFDIRRKMSEALRWARLFGASAIIIGTKSGRPDEAFDVERMAQGDLQFLHLAVSPTLIVKDWETDFNSPRFGQPSLYTFSPANPGSMATTAVDVHASRVIPFTGVELPPNASRGLTAWGDSVFTSILDTLVTAGSITSVIASLVLEAKLDVVKIADLGALLSTPGGEDKIRKRFALAASLKSVNNMLLLGEGEEYDQKTLSFTGLSDIHIRIMQEVSGAADIPATRLLGQTPAGLQSTGESDLRNYYDMIQARQETSLRGALERCDRIVFASEGIELPREAYFSFNALWQETPTQKAENALKKAQATKALHTTGLIEEGVLARGVISQLIEDGVYPSLDTAVKEGA
ncbi:MAG: Phage-associated protein family [Hyphomicrobiales bacterium]|nr:Phage-associated protein family [Hyphomicrobiales bacterium]